MSSESTTPPVIPSSPSKHENLVGAILWLLPPEQIPDHGRYKLKAKACGHPCVVVQDCRTTEPDFVRICILASYSHENPYKTLGISEQYDHVPIHPNSPDARVKPNILYLRHRQRIEMLLKKKSWVNTKRVYKVPVVILRPYETFQSWCRYRLTDTSIQALQSALLINALESTLQPTSSQTLSSPVLSDEQSPPDDSLASPDVFWNPVGSASQNLLSQGTNVTQSDKSALDPTETLSEPLIQLSADVENSSDNIPSEDADTGGSNKPRVPLSYKQSPFYITFPFDAGPYSRTIPENDDLSSATSLLPPPATASNTRSRPRLSRRAQNVVCFCGAFIVLSLIIVFVLGLTKAKNFISATCLQLLAWIAPSKNFQ